MMLPITQYSCLSCDTFRPVLSKVKEKSVISLPGWVTMEIPVIEETPISQMSQV